MSKRIKGISIEIEGKTTGLDKALGDITKKTHDVQKELRDVERLLKFNPDNVVLMTQKQELLSKQVHTTSEKLNGLRKAQENVNKQFKEGKITEKQYQNFQREIIETESKLKHYVKQLKEVSKEHRSLSENIEKAGKSFKEFGNKSVDMGSKLTTKVTAPITAVGTAASMVGMDFEKVMSTVQAMYGIVDKSSPAYKELADEIERLGSTTKYSQSEVAEAFNYTALAGWSVTESVKGMEGILNTAIATNMDLATASDIVTDTLSMFSMEASESGRMADVLAKASVSTNTSVEELGEALKYVGANANSSNLDIEKTTTLLGLLADNGLKGSIAGTTLNSILNDLKNGFQKNKLEIEGNNIAIYDANKQMRPLGDIMHDISVATKDMKDETRDAALMNIFGVEAMKGVNIILSEGSDKYYELENSMYDAKGTAQDMSKVMSDNVAGDLDEMKASIEKLAITIFEILKPAIKGIIGFLTDLARGFQSLPDSVQKFIIILSGVVAAVGPVLVIFGKLIVLIGGVMSNISILSGVLTALTGPVGLVVAGITALTVGSVALIKNFKKTSKESDLFKKDMEGVSETTRKTAEGFFELSESVENNLTYMYASGVKITKQMSKDIVDDISKMNNEIIQLEKDNYEERRKTTERILTSNKDLSSTQHTNILAREQEFHEKRIVEHKKREEEMLDIIREAEKEKGVLTQEQHNRLLELKEEMNSEVIDLAAESEKEQTLLKEKYLAERENLDIEKTAEMIKRAVKTRDKLTKEAEKQYDEELKHIISLRDESKVISHETAEQMIKDAKRRKDETVNSAKEQHDEVLRFAKEQGEEHLKYVNTETGEVLSKWGVFKKDTSKVLSEMKDNVLNYFKDNKKAREEDYINQGKNWDKVKKLTRESYDWVKDYVSNFFADRSKEFKDIKSNLIKGLEDLKNKIKDKVGSIGDVFNDKWKEIKNLGKTIRKNFSTFFDNLKTTAKRKAQEVVNNITKPIRDIFTAVDKVIKDIKRLFAKTKFTFPKIPAPKMPKLPSFTMNGVTQTPKVNWNAAGGIFKKPTIFNTQNAGLQGVGEAGSEAILPLNSKTLGSIGKGIAQELDLNNNGLVEVSIQPAPVILDGKKIGEVTFNTTSQQLGDKQRMTNYMRGL